MNWREARLRDLVFFQRGFDITKDQQQDGEVPVISSSGVQSYHSEAKVAGPGVIIGRKGSLGTVHYSDGPYWPHDTTLWSKDLHGNDPRFVYYFVKTLNLKRFDVGNSNPTLNRNHIHDMKVIIPPLPVQERIALIISTYDNLIEVNRRRIYLLEQAARQLYREWFVRLRFPGHERVKIIDGVPEGWERLTALDVMEVLSGGTPKTDVSEFWDGGIPFFTPKDVTNGVYVHDTQKTLTEYGLKNCSSRLYPQDTIFITARGTVGNLNLAQTDMAMNQSCYALLARPPLDQYFLYLALVESVEQFRSRAVGAVFEAIIRDTFKLIPFLVPDKEALRAFSDCIRPLVRQIDILTTQNRKLTAARNLLLPRLMSGEIAV
jgi:type I restriction enzyme S subunit